MCVVKFLITFLQILNCFSGFSSGSALSIHDPLVLDCSKSYNNIMRDLRANWQSPIMYLKKRGYIPKSEQHGIPLKLSGVIDQPIGKITHDNNKQPIAAKNNQMHKKLDKLTKLCDSKAGSNLAAATKLAQESPHHTNGLPTESANLTPPHANALPVNHAKASTLVPGTVKVQIPLRIQVPSAVGLNVGPSAEVLSDAAGPHSGHKPAHKVSFLHSMKDKLLGLFSKKPPIDIKKDIYNFEYNTNDGDVLEQLAQDQYNQYNSNKNDLKELDESKEIDRELQFFLDDLKKNRRRTNDKNSLKKPINKQDRHSKLKTRSNDYAAS